MEIVKCEYCGKEKKDSIFVIGASNKPDWCMHEGTGKMSCPECYEKASKEGQSRIKDHVESYRVQRSYR